MELFDFESGLASVASGGNVLNCQEVSSLKTSLSALKSKEQHRQVFLWGKVFGLQADYYVAYALKTGELEFPSKLFYYAGADFVFQPLEQPSTEVAEKLAKLAGDKPLSGVPGTLLEPAADPDGGDPPPADGDDGQPAPTGPKKLTEVDRLALLVGKIDFDTAAVPRGAHTLSDSHMVIPNNDFKGLGLTEASMLNSYVHFRAPISIASLRALARADCQFFADFLDPLDGDLPKGCWAVRQEGPMGLVTLRSLHWPGYIAFHIPGTTKFGGLYFGHAMKNVELPFMV